MRDVDLDHIRRGPRINPVEQPVAGEASSDHAHGDIPCLGHRHRLGQVGQPIRQRNVAGRGGPESQARQPGYAYPEAHGENKAGRGNKPGSTWAHETCSDGPVKTLRRQGNGASAHWSRSVAIIAANPPPPIAPRISLTSRTSIRRLWIE